MIVTIYFEVDHKKLVLGQKTAFLDPKRATLGNRGHETASQAAKRPPTGKPKVSRATPGHGGPTIPLSRDRPSRKNGGSIGAAQKNAEFRAENAVFWPKIHFFAKSVQLFCYHHDRTTKRQHFCFDPVARRASGRPQVPDFGPKICIFFTLRLYNPHFFGSAGPDSV